MKTLLAFTALAICASQVCMAQIGKLPAIEQSIYKPAAPFENIKRLFYVREQELPLLDSIADASTSIARFLIEVPSISPVKATTAIAQVPAEALNDLRLPPAATHDGTSRFVDSTLYCWTSKEKDHLEFLIEWADITTHAR